MLDDDFTRFKTDINLVDYAAQYGYQRVRRESSRASVSMRHPVSDDKIIVARSRAGHWIYFSVRDERDNGTIVDFVLRRENKSLGEVREDLRRWLGMARTEPSLVARRNELLCATPDPEAVRRTYMAARAVPTSRYLNERGLRDETLGHWKFAATWKEDARGNLLFAHYDTAGLAGYEIKNRGFTAFATGGTKALWLSLPEPTETILVVAESAIDAMSYHQLRRQPARRTRYASLAGAPSSLQLDLVDKMLGRMPAGSALVAAVDADHGGDRIARLLEGVARKRQGVDFQRDSPDASLYKDWNQVVQRIERDFIQSLPPSLGPRGRGLAITRGR